MDVNGNYTMRAAGNEQTFQFCLPSTIVRKRKLVVDLAPQPQWFHNFNSVLEVILRILNTEYVLNISNISNISTGQKQENGHVMDFGLRRVGPVFDFIGEAGVMIHDC